MCVKICVKIFHLGFSGKAHKSFRSRKSDLINSGNLVELSQHRVEGRDSNLENQLVSVYEFFFVLVLSYFKANCDIKCSLFILQHGW